MSQNITLLGASYSAVPAITLPKTGGGTATFTDVTDTTATASDVAQGLYFYTSAGVRTAGTASGGGGDSYTRTVVVPQQTFTPTTDQNNAYQAALTYTSGLVSGEPYIITYDGEEYVCDCSDPLWGSDRMMGTIAAMWGDRGDGVFPFAVDYTGGAMYVAAFDLNQHTIKVEHLEFVDGPLNLIAKSVTANGTYTASSDNADGYSSVTVNVPSGGGSMQTKTVTPTTSQQTVQPDSGYDGLSQVTVNAIPSQYIVPSGNKSITANGTNIDVAEYATVSVNDSGSSKNVQTAQSTTRVANTAYTKTASLTCAVSGTYDVYWDCFRSTTSGTSGSQLYIGGTASGSANTTFSNHAQNNHRTGVHINANQDVAVYVRSRATNYYAYCGQLTIVQTA